MLPPTQEHLLSWYFGEGHTVLTAPSGMGPALQHAQLYGDIEDRPRRGANVEITARPSPPARTYEPSWTPCEERLSQWGETSRRLLKLREVDPRFVEVFATVWGDSGARWGRTKQGRLASLIPMVPAGRALLSKARKKAGAGHLRLTEAQAVENAVHASEKLEDHPGMRRALAECHQLFERACKAYMKVVEAELEERWHRQLAG